ncbi:phosphatase PAP2 family protein [Sphingobacterium puteale]|uniref:Phosphatase PAP2 family protein n=1 Tax=Sphingobacterium puteale TaxID=2420510 RepID=A0A420W0H6_9SPHI|nr:phosphatase PAP2 family protein [Sphingobacterium puteale]RKO72072.1 phosphatase PAP2 family protein [Sphingobacterium puteale]
MKVAILITIVCSLFGNLAFGMFIGTSLDTLVGNESAHVDSSDNMYKPSYKRTIIPSICIGYGILSLTNPGIKEINSSTRFEIGEHSPSHIKVDNYTQFIPGALVYGLNEIGIKGKHDFKDRSIILATSLLLSTAIVTPTKHLVHEKRPDGSNSLSFPSGHTATAFATAHFMFREYRGHNLWLSFLGYPFAIFTGTYRTFNDKHWVGDVVAGAGIGILSTEFAYWSFPKISKLFGNKQDNKMIYIPYYQSNQLGFNCILKF